MKEYPLITEDVIAGAHCRAQFRKMYDQASAKAGGADWDTVKEWTVETFAAIAATNGMRIVYDSGYHMTGIHSLSLKQVVEALAQIKVEENIK